MNQNTICKLIPKTRGDLPKSGIILSARARCLQLFSGSEDVIHFDSGIPVPRYHNALNQFGRGSTRERRGGTDVPWGEILWAAETLWVDGRPAAASSPRQGGAGEGKGEKGGLINRRGSARLGSSRVRSDEPAASSGCLCYYDRDNRERVMFAFVDYYSTLSKNSRQK